MPGRLKQSAARWCYSKIAIDDLCRQAADIGLVALDLIDEKDWPVLKKYNLVPAMVSGAGSIPVAWNRLENHDRLEKDMRTNIEKAAAAKLPNVITFSGNRRGMNDEEGKANTIAGLNRVEEVRRGCGRHHLHGVAEQQGGPQGLHVRPHGVGRGRCARRWIRRG